MSRQKLLACSEQTHVPIFNPKWKTVAPQFRDSILYRHNQQTPRKTQRVGGNGGELTVYPITTAELKAVDCCFALLQLKETPLSFCFPSNGHNTRPQLNVMDDLLLVYGDDDSLPPVHPFLSRSPFFFFFSSFRTGYLFICHYYTCTYIFVLIFFQFWFLHIAEKIGILESYVFKWGTISHVMIKRNFSLLCRVRE